MSVEATASDSRVLAALHDLAAAALVSVGAASDLADGKKKIALGRRDFDDEAPTNPRAVLMQAIESDRINEEMHLRGRFQAEAVFRIVLEYTVPSEFTGSDCYLTAINLFAGFIDLLWAHHEDDCKAHNNAPSRWPFLLIGTSQEQEPQNPGEAEEDESADPGTALETNVFFASYLIRLSDYQRQARRIA